MNQFKLKASIEDFKTEMGSGLKSFSLMLKQTGQSVYSYNSEPAMESFILKGIMEIEKTLPISEYALFDDSDGDVIFSIDREDVLAIIKFDPKKILIGMFLGVILPKFREKAREALDENSSL